MLNGVEYVRDICKKKRIAISTLEKDCGFANGYLNPKKVSKIPYDRAILISDYLGVEVENILGTKKQNETQLTKKDERDITRDINNIIRKLSESEDGPALYDGNPLSDESTELFKEELEIALRRLKLINKEKYNPSKNKK